jgi:hypothetical protein
VRFAPCTCIRSTTDPFKTIGRASPSNLPALDADPVASSKASAPSANPPVTGEVRDPLAVKQTVIAARRRPMSERLELALSWNAVAAELRAGLSVAIGQTNSKQ